LWGANRSPINKGIKMPSHTVSFERNENGMKLLAVFLAGIVREGITYSVQTDACEVTVEILGGY
jgi:hypothetical protein